MQQFSRRMKKILEYVLENNLVRASELTDRFGVSKRTLYYDLASINYSLSQMGLPGIVSGSQGFYIENKNKEAIVSALGIQQFHEYASSSTERCYRILWKIIKDGNMCRFSDVQEDLGVSRNTAVNDIAAVRSLLKGYSLELVSKNGYHVEGEEINRRILFSTLFNDYGYLMPDHPMKNPGDLVDDEYIRKYLITFYTYGYRRKGLDYETVQRYLHQDVSGVLREIEEACSVQIDPSECGFVEMMMQENFDMIRRFRELEPEKELEYKDDVRKIIREFEKQSCIYIDDSEELVQRIMEHLLPFILRARVGIYCANGMKDQIRKKYSVVYKLTETALQPYSDCFENFRFTEDMVAYLVLYFGAIIHDAYALETLPRILIVCNKGYATSQILAQQIREIFNNLEIVGVVSSAAVKEYEGLFDYIVTSERIEEDSRVICVNPFLTTDDQAKLLYRIADLRLKKNSRFDVEGIVDKLEESATIHDRAKLMADLTVLLNEAKEQGERVSPHIWEVTDPGMYRYVDEECSWMDALLLGSGPLLEAGRISKQYIHAMIDSIEKNGPYMIVGDDLALAHATPMDGVHHLGVSVTVFSKPVWIQDRSFRVLVVLAPVDKKRHMTILADINEIVQNAKNYERVKSVMDSEALAELFLERRM